MEIDKLLDELVSYMSKIITVVVDEATNLLREMVGILDINKRVKYLAFHHRKTRVKKKNMNRLIKLLKRRALCGRA